MKPPWRPTLALLVLTAGSTKLVMCPPPGCPTVDLISGLPTRELISYRQQIRGDDPVEKTKGIAALRRHAWSLFRDVTAQSATCDRPAWRRWPDKEETFRTPGPNRASTQPVIRLEAAYELTVLLTGLLTQGVDTPPTFEAVNYNPTAYRHIRRSRLFEADVGERRIGNGDRGVPEFPPGAVIVKTFWRVVPEHGSAPLGLWDWSELCFPRASHESDWARHVCIYQTDPEQAEPKCRVSADEFYSIKVENPADFTCLGCSGAVKAGDRLILIAMHITTKEIPDWLWATFWWRGIDRTDGDEWYRDNAQRPDGFRAPWTNYSMDATLGRWNRGGELDKRDTAIFNPYIEAALATDTNCVSCHSQASISGRPTIHLDPSLPFLEGQLATDFLWSVAAKMAPHKR